MIKDLRDWIQKAEEIGELKRVKREVDWDQEVTAIDYLVGKVPESPSLLFEKIKGYPPGYRVLGNFPGPSANRVAVTLGILASLSDTRFVNVTRTDFSRRSKQTVVNELFLEKTRRHEVPGSQDLSPRRGALHRHR
jgi:UbiD family decarboxylase